MLHLLPLQKQNQEELLQCRKRNPEKYNCSGRSQLRRFI
jgi:hypothetical protein